MPIDDDLGVVVVIVIGAGTIGDITLDEYLAALKDLDIHWETVERR